MAGRSSNHKITIRPDNAEIINALKRGKDPGSLGISKTEQGKTDLRGIILPRTNGVVPAKESEWGSPLFKIKKLYFDNVDFSGADLSDARFVRCVFTNCLFEKTKMELVHFEATLIRDCRFVNASLYQSSFENIGNDAGLIQNTYFIKTDMRYTSFGFPVITDTVFDHCKMNEVDFDSSRFTNCKFKGKLDIVFFRGYSWHWRPGIRLFGWVNYKNFRNPMMNVDFTEAELGDVNFSHGIDLSHCTFPRDENLLVIKNTARVYEQARKIIAETWTGKERDLYIKLIDEAYYMPDRRDQQMNVLQCEPDDAADKKFFQLVKSINDSL